LPIVAQLFRSILDNYTHDNYTLDNGQLEPRPGDCHL
jgi:hypothetical protein